MTFATRQEAGRKLGEFLARRQPGADLVLGLPRGGVVVAAEVARILKLPLDVVVVRKIGHPWHREFAVGALAEGDIVVLDENSIGEDPEVRRELDLVIAEETRRLREYRRKFRRTKPVEREGKTVLVVDDGLATGATMEVAVRAVRAQLARLVIVAVPVASTSAVNRLARVANDVVALVVDPDFMAVGDYYAEFEQTSDADVQALLRESEAAGR